MKTKLITSLSILAILLFALFVINTNMFFDPKSNKQKIENCSKNNNYKCALNYSKKQLEYDFKNNNSKVKIIIKDYMQIGDNLIKLGKNKKALNHYLKALSISQKNLGENNKQTAESYYKVGNTFSYLKEYKKTLEYYKKALKIYKNLPNNTDNTQFLLLNIKYIKHKMH